VILISYLHQAPRLRVNGAIILLLLYPFIAWTGAELLCLNFTPREGLLLLFIESKWSGNVARMGRKTSVKILMRYLQMGDRFENRSIGWMVILI